MLPISIHLMFLLIRWLPNNVCIMLYFNTSHVSINRSGRLTEYYILRNFNTSHVSINPGSPVLPPDRSVISIHLMFLLIMSHQTVQSSTPHFNTSHVSINPTLLSAFPFLLYLKFLENTSFFKFFPYF